MQRLGHRYLDAQTKQGLDCWFALGEDQIARDCLAQKVGILTSEFVTVELGDIQAPPENIEQAYLRLHLLSERQYQPNQLNLDGIFGLLANIAWTSAGPVLPERIDELRAKIANSCHHLTICSVDKFPRMTDYVLPRGVRIADADRVRLGAHLAPGTTVMHEGFVNFNAGTLGQSMVEGRITPGVVVGNHSDIGAGASIMGTLSGGGKQVNAIGEHCLLGANAGIGISLGDGCIVEAGLYLTAGTKVTMPDGSVVSAKSLSGQSGLLYRRNSISGKVEALPSKASNWGGLNTELHSN